MDGGGDRPAEEGLPSVRLPFADSLATQASQASVGDSQPAAASAAGAAAGEESPLDEDDLFGSGGEESPPRGGEAAAAPAAAAAAPAAAPAASAAAPPGAGDGADDLFGSEAGGDLNERELFGSDEEGEVDERALFGSDDEGERPRELPPRSPGALSEMSEMDERDIFGEISEDEPEKVEDITLRRRPHPSDDRDFVTMRLPNVLSIERTPFNAEAIPQTLLEGFKEFTNTMKKKSTRLLNPENCVRWRFKKGPDGHNLTDEDGRPQYESNSRIVEWEDGTKTLFVGREAFDITEIEDRIILFEENTQDVHVCHGSVGKRFTVTPRNLESKTHDMLKRSQFHKFEAIRRSLLMSQEEQDAHQALLEIQAGQRQQQLRSDQRKRALEPDPTQMTAADLEGLEDDAADAAGGIGPSVKEIKDQAKRPRPS